MIESEQHREPRGVIFLLISPDKKVLMQLRDQWDTRFPGRWCFPGGACDGDEEFIQTVLREAKEEFTAELDASECFLIMRRLGNQNAVYACPIGSTDGFKLQEGADMQWMSFDQIERLELGFHQFDILPSLREFFQFGDVNAVAARQKSPNWESHKPTLRKHRVAGM